jgi:hypothetical protein
LYAVHRLEEEFKQSVATADARVRGAEDRASKAEEECARLGRWDS